MQSLLYKCPHCDAPVEVEPRDQDAVISCPRCDKPFEARVPVAEPENGPLVASANGNAAWPDTPPEAQPVGRADEARPAPPAPVEAAETVPPADEPAERTVLEVQPCMFRRYPGRFLGLVALMAAGLTALVVSLVYGWWLLTAAAVAVLGYSVYHIGRWWLRVRATKLTVTNKRSIVQHGMFQREQVQIQHEDLDTLQVHQGFWARQLNVGDLGITTNSEAGKQQVFVMAIADPQGVAETIRRQVQPAPPADEGVREATAPPAEDRQD